MGRNDHHINTIQYNGITSLLSNPEVSGSIFNSALCVSVSFFPLLSVLSSEKPLYSRRSPPNGIHIPVYKGSRRRSTSISICFGFLAQWKNLVIYLSRVSGSIPDTALWVSVSFFMLWLLCLREKPLHSAEDRSGEALQRYPCSCMFTVDSSNPDTTIDDIKGKMKKTNIL